MPPEIPSGLLDMEARARRAPAPRHAKLSVETPAPPAPPPPAPAPPAPAVPAASELRGTMVYLDSPALELIRACQGAGKVSASAIIRLALRDLSATPPAKITARLLNGDTAQRSPGRKRLG